VTVMRHPPTPRNQPAQQVKTVEPAEALLEHVPALRAFALALVRNRSDADDLVQETLVKAWSNLEKYTPGTNLRAWLFTILRNTFFSARRKHKREVPDPEGVHAAKLVEKPAHDGRLAFSEFLVAFDKLSSEHREVLMLVGAEGFSCEEAAAMIGVAVGTIKSRASRARAHLAELMGVPRGTQVLPDEDGRVLAVIGRSGIAAA
jgi:RNA polymerase sigma-70 factor, ECF subfamily